MIGAAERARLAGGSAGLGEEGLAGLRWRWGDAGAHLRAGGRERGRGGPARAHCWDDPRAAKAKPVPEPERRGRRRIDALRARLRLPGPALGPGMGRPRRGPAPGAACRVAGCWLAGWQAGLRGRRHQALGPPRCRCWAFRSRLRYFPRPRIRLPLEGCSPAFWVGGGVLSCPSERSLELPPLAAASSPFLLFPFHPPPTLRCFLFIYFSSSSAPPPQPPTLRS